MPTRHDLETAEPPAARPTRRPADPHPARSRPLAVNRYQYAQKLYPPKPKKKLGAKQMKRERLKQGLRPAGGD